MSILLNDEEIGRTYDTALSECPHFQWDSLGVGRYLVRAQAKHIVEWIEKKNISLDINDYVAIEGDMWQELRKEAGIDEST